MSDDNVIGKMSVHELARRAVVMPDAVAIDANGYWWRVWGEDPMWSMVPVNPDNSPIPEPVTFYRLVPMNLPSDGERHDD